MTLRQTLSTGDGLHRAEIEQAAKTLRERLSFATIKATTHGSVSVQSLQDLLPPSPSPFSSAYTSPSTASTSPAEGGESNGEFRSETESSNEHYVKPPSPPSKPSNSSSRGLSPKRVKRDTSTTREPSLYDAIFGPGYSQVGQASLSSASIDSSRSSKTSSTSPPMARSTHVRRGSSAQLEKAAMSPRIAQSPLWSPHARFLSRELEPMKHGVHQRAESFFAHPLSSPSKDRQVSISEFSSPIEHHHNHQSQPRHRMKSAGGSVLPNGHPASSLAQDLGIASGSTPRSRQSSINYAFQQADHRNSRLQYEDRFDQAETDRLAGLLTKTAEEDSRKTSTPPRSTSSFADPNLFVTPRRRRRRSNGEDMDAAAHSLLDLASSPSPVLGSRHQARFPGATPSLDRIFDRAEAKPRRLFDDEGCGADGSPSSAVEGRERSPESVAGLHSAISLKSSSIVDKSTSPPSRYPQASISPPMTPPRSESRPRKRSAFDSASMSPSSSCPSTPTKRGQMALLYGEEEEEEKEGEANRRERGRSRGLAGIVAPHKAAHTAAKEGESAAASTAMVIETPRTPPPISAPTTPKAPGSNFSYGDFLHVSPSPQPRMRMHSSSGTPILKSLQNTPTRATKSRARFGSINNNSGNYDDDDAGSGVRHPSNSLLTELELSRTTSSIDDVLTPGKFVFASSPRLGGLGLQQSPSSKSKALQRYD